MLSVAYLQNCRALKKDGYNVSPVTKKLVKILKEGAEYGIHLMLYSLTEVRKRLVEEDQLLVEQINLWFEQGFC